MKSLILTLLLFGFNFAHAEDKDLDEVFVPINFFPTLDKNQEYFKETNVSIGLQQVDWTVNDHLQGKKIVLGLETAGYSSSENNVEYFISEIDLSAGISSEGVDYIYLRFSPLSVHESRTIAKKDGIRLIKKVVDYGQFNAERDRLIGQELLVSFEPIHGEMTFGYAASRNTQLEFGIGSGVGYSYAESIDDDYDGVYNFYVDLDLHMGVKNKKIGNFSIDYGVNSGAVTQNIREGSPQVTSRQGRVRATYLVKINTQTNCELYAEKKSFQVNPGYDELDGTKQDRYYEKAKTYGIGCDYQF